MSSAAEGLCTHPDTEVGLRNKATSDSEQCSQDLAISAKIDFPQMISSCSGCLLESSSIQKYDILSMQNVTEH